VKILIVKGSGFAPVLKSKLVGRKREFGANDTVFETDNITDAERILEAEDVRLLIIGLNLDPEAAKNGDMLSGWHWLCKWVLPEYPKLAHRIIVFSSHLSELSEIPHTEIDDDDIVCAPTAEMFNDVLQNKRSIDRLVERIFQIHKEIKIDDLIGKIFELDPEIKLSKLYKRIEEMHSEI
jgi:hypothetical protein